VIRDLADPEPGPNDVIVRVRASGVCGSDLHTSDTFVPPGAGVMGHEFAGEVVALGRLAGRFRVGDRVTALPYIGCGSCVACLNGQGHRCPAVISGGFGKLPGAYAEFVRVGVHEALPLPPEVDFRQGALVEPLAVGLHTVERAGLRPGDVAQIIGAGPIGLAVSLWCRFFGAGHVLFAQSKQLTSGRVQIYSDNAAVARWLQRSIETLLFPAFADESLPIIAAEFARGGDPRAAAWETVTSANEKIRLTWYDCIAPFVLTMAPGTNNRPIGVFSTFFPARSAQAEINGMAATNKPWAEKRGDWLFCGTCCTKTGWDSALMESGLQCRQVSWSPPTFRARRTTFATSSTSACSTWIGPRSRRAGPSRSIARASCWARRSTGRSD